MTGRSSVAPDHVKALNNRGLALQALNRHPEALASYGRAVEIQKDYADAHFNQALALLTIGDFRRGFAKYEWRWRRTGMPAERRGHGRPLWLGEYPLQRKTILLHAEQDWETRSSSRAMSRCWRERAPRSSWRCSGSSCRCWRRSRARASVVARGQPLPAFDVHCPLGSLPLALKTEPGTIPAEIPYVTADEARIAKWRPRIAGLGTGIERPKVAMAWSGNAQHSNDRNRSIALSQLASLWSTDRAPVCRHSARAARTNIPDCSPAMDAWSQVGIELDDFADTAAVLALVDLVITVDTSVAHLAGAMGRPVWILLPFSPDWRWTLEGETQPMVSERATVQATGARGLGKRDRARLPRARAVQREAP